jgi:hypothetical protein
LIAKSGSRFILKWPYNCLKNIKMQTFGKLFKEVKF